MSVGRPLRAGALAVAVSAVLAGCSSTSEAPEATPAHGTSLGAGHGRPAAGSGGVQELLPGPEARTVRGAVTAMFDAYRDKDLSRWLGAWTDEGFEEAFGVTKTEATLVPPSWGDVRSFRESSVQLLGLVEHGDHMSVRDAHGSGLPAEHGLGEHAVIDTAEAGIVTRQRLDLTLERKRWRVTARTALPAEPTGDIVTVRLTEYGIELSAPTAGRSFVLRVDNDGLVDHELLLLRDRGGQDETVGRVAAQQPGQSRDLVASALPPGDYALVCNLLDGDGRPHSTLGMRAVLTVN